LKRYNYKFPKKWRFFDESGKITILHYNGDKDQPMLTYGWSRLRKRYRFNEHKIIACFYCGKNTFKLLISNNEFNTNFIPKYHSRSTNERYTKYFDITLSRFQMTMNHQLVTNHYSLLIKFVFTTFFFINIDGVCLFYRYLIGLLEIMLEKIILLN
jgi:hypothetical protein